MPSAKMKRMEDSLARCGQEEDQDPLAAGRYGNREIPSLKMDSSRSYSVKDCCGKRRKKSRLDVRGQVMDHHKLMPWSGNIRSLPRSGIIFRKNE